MLRTLSFVAALAAFAGCSAYAQNAPIGSAPYPAVMESDPGLRTHTIYRPSDLAAVKGKLPIVAWGNGACANLGNAFQGFLTEIASHGYLVVAIGPIGDVSFMERMARTMPPGGPPRGGPPPGASGGPPPPESEASQLIDAVNWAIGENARRDSRYFRRLAANRIALMGQSCGGLQVLQVNGDPRVTTSVVLNSGIFPSGNPIPRMSIGKDALNHIHSPTLYLLGGPSDIAYENGMDDVARIRRVPVFVGNLDVGHMGTFWQPNGGRFAQVVSAWLDWRLKLDRGAGAMFTGARCGLCVDPEWQVQRRNMR